MAAARDSSIDILRALALLGMIVSHCNPHPFIMQLREFDVPLIVFLSGVSFLLSSKKNLKNEYFPYCWKRLKRLVFPTWIFLCIYYFVLFVGLSYTGNLAIDWKGVLQNFSLMTGWYVWIIRVFLIIALFAPLVVSVTRRINALVFGLLFIIILIGYEYIAGESNDSIYYYLSMTIPYVLFFAYGTFTDKLSNKYLFAVIIVSVAIYIFYAVLYYKAFGTYQGTQICKYPPRLYYTSYALAVVSFLWLTRYYVSKIFVRIKLADIMTYIGSHTLWIYFWHIIILLVFEDKINNSFLLFGVVILLSILIDLLQVIVFKWIIQKIKSEHIKRNISLLFLG